MGIGFGRFRAKAKGGRGTKRSKRSTQAVETNLLEMVPQLRSHLSLESGGDGKVTVLLPRRNWLERQSVRFLRQPAVIKVHLDDLGSEVISRCGGTQTVAEIAEAIKAKHGEAAEPLLPRLSKFIEILEANDWLTWIIPDEKKGNVSSAGKK